ncbi:hypothetical protein AAG906_007546 [Vitis piasezkii]
MLVADAAPRRIRLQCHQYPHLSSNPHPIAVARFPPACANAFRHAPRHTAVMLVTRWPRMSGYVKGHPISPSCPTRILGSSRCDSRHWLQFARPEGHKDRRRLRGFTDLPLSSNIPISPNTIPAEGSRGACAALLDAAPRPTVYKGQQYPQLAQPVILIPIAASQGLAA